MNKKKHVPPPKAFQRSRYAAISNLDADGWYTQLERRRLIAGTHDYLQQGFPRTEFDTTIEALRTEMDEVLRSPLVWPPSSDFASASEIKSRMAPRLTAVHSPTIIEFYGIEDKIPPALRKEALKEMPRVFGSQGSRTSLVSKVVRSAEAVGLVTVDLTLSDSAIKADFAEWLSSIRLSEPLLAPRPKNYGPEIKTWVKMGLLPCIDLLLWGRLNGVKMSPRKLSHAIHEDFQYKEATVRLACKPLALAILDDHPRGQVILASLKAKWARETVDRDTTPLRIGHQNKSRRKRS